MDSTKISSTRKGYIGQEIVANYLLRKNLRVYTPVVDDFGVDLLVEINNKYTSVQVKYHTRFTNPTSIQVDISATNADWIAIPMSINENIKILWYKNPDETISRGMKFVEQASKL